MWPLISYFSLSQNVDKAKEELKSALQFLDTYLLTRTYLAGERITLADIVLTVTLLELYTYVADSAFR